MPRLSIITINYNDKAGLAKTVESVLSQTFRDIEYIVIDGGSSDGSVEVMKKYREGIHYLVSEKDGGIFNAQNKGLAKASGEYCLFLNSGDFLVESTCIEKVFATEAKADIVYGNMMIENDKGEIAFGQSPEQLSVYDFMISTLWHPVSFIKREVFGKYGDYDENFKITADYEFFVRAIVKWGVSTQYLPVTVSVFNTRGVGSSEKYRIAREEEKERALKKNLSPLLIEMAKEYTRIVRSKPYLIGEKIKKIIKPTAKKS